MFETRSRKDFRRRSSLWVVPVMLAFLLSTSGIGLMASARAEQRNLPSFQAGVAVYVYGNDPEFGERSTVIVDRLVTMNVTHVSLVYFFTQDSWTASAVQADPGMTTSKENLEVFVEAAHDKGLAVTLRPVLEETSLIPDGQWRGSIQPQDRAAWFASYTAFITDYAAVAEEQGVELFNIGTELSSLEDATDEWTRIIQAVRGVYSGEIVYSYTWDSNQMGRLPGLDFIGVDAFVPLDLPPGAGADQLLSAWTPFIAQLDEVRQTTGTPILLTEVGVRSQAGSYRTPFLWKEDAPVSQQDQADFFSAICQGRSLAVVTETGVRLRNQPSLDANIIAEVNEGTRLMPAGNSVTGGDQNWSPVVDPATGDRGFIADEAIELRPVFDGMYVWAVDFNQGVDVPPDDPGFSPMGKLAEDVIAGCYEDATDTR